jgi:primosomal protein N' (replication factor Y)
MELLDIQKKDEYNEALFYGITGSGKSEVYMHLIEEVIKENRSVIIMVPEIALTAQMLSMFSTRFGNNVALLHSRLSTGERYDQWHRIKKGKASIVLGTRSAVFAPVKDIGLIILDEEHDSSYKSETVPRYHAADIARKRCMDNRAFLLYGSATPRVDSFYKALSGKINFLSLEKRAVNQNLPDVSIVDMKNEVEGGKYNNLSAVFKEKLINTLKKGEQAMILLNRRGYAKIIVCMECGYKTMCPNCTISLTYHSSGNRLICHYCGYTRKKTDNCINCGSDKLVPIGTGTQQIEKELDDINESADEVIIRHGRMDIDTTGKKNSVDKIINDFRKNKQNVLVGTQMIAKGHDIHNVTLVGILSADMMLASEDFRANEKTFQLITQAAGRAGRGDKDGSVIIQCFDTENYSIESAIKHDYRNFYKNEIQIRKKLMYPPFTNIGQIMLSGKNPGQVKFEIMRLRNGTEEIIKETDTELIGPSTAPVYKINDRFRWRMVLKQRDFEILLKILTHIYDSNSDALKKKGIRLLLDINPFNML